MSSKKNQEPETKVSLKQRAGKRVNEFWTEVVALYALIATVAQAMGGYILIFQANKTFKVVGVVLVVNATVMAYQKYTRHGN